MVIKFSSPKRDRRLGGACEVEIMDLVEVSDVLNFGTNSSLGFISTGLFVYGELFVFSRSARKNVSSLYDGLMSWNE